MERVVVMATLTAAAVLPVFNLDTIMRAQDEKETMGNLGAPRSALSIHHGDMEGLYPVEFASFWPSY